MTARVSLLTLALLAAAHADTLYLKDGTHITGRWWSLDASQLHFLVNNQLQHYARKDVSAVTFGDATLPAPPAPTAPAPAPTAAAPKASASAAPAPAPAAETPRSAGPPSLMHPPSLNRPPAAESPAPASERVTEPQEIAAVYFQRKAHDLTPLEKGTAVERRRGSTTYYEIPGAQSRVRVKAAPELVFAVRLPKGVDPASYSLFPMATANGARRTQNQPGRRGGLLTWPFEIEKVDESGYITYTFTVKDLPTGEYSFSPSSSNDGYSFGVD